MFSFFSKPKLKRRKAADHAVRMASLSDATLHDLKSSVFADMAETGWVECRAMVRFEHKPEGLVIVVDVPGAAGLIVASDAINTENAESLQLTYKKVVEVLSEKALSELTIASEPSSAQTQNNVA